MIKCKTNLENMFDCLNQQQINCALKDLGEDKNRLENAENLLNNWIRNQLKVAGTYDRNVVRNFLRGSKHDLRKAQSYLENYFGMRASFPGLFSNRNPFSEEIRRNFDKIYIAPLQQLTRKGERVWFCTLTDLEINFDMGTTGKILFMFYDLLMLLDLPVSGEVLVLDGANFTGADSVNFLSSAFRNMITVLRNVYAIRLKEIHIVNPPAMADKLLAVIKPLLHQKIQKRFKIHHNNDSLLDYFPPEVLPSDYKGNGKSLKENVRKWQEVMMDFSDWFKEQEESFSKIPRPHTVTYEIQGSFRKLNID